jgi:hypothetical protein
MTEVSMLRSGDGETGIGVLVGALLVVVAMTVLIMNAGSFGHTHRLNADLTAPQLSSPAEPGFK